MQLNKEQVLDKLKDILIEDLHVPLDKEDLHVDKSLFSEGVNLDSLDIMELVNRIDEVFEVDLIEEEQEQFQTLGLLCDRIIQVHMEALC